MSKDYDIPNLSKPTIQTRPSRQQTMIKKEKPFWPKFLLWILCMIVCFGLGYGIFYAQKLQTFIQANTGQKITAAQPIHTKTSLPSIVEPTDQTNILLLGSDNDQKFSGSNPLTQTMMVVHINYDTKSVDMFSIPRDLWIQKPDGTYGKIDQAAEEQGIPSAITAVEQTFGIHIDHYAWVGLYGFIKSIDAVGGVNLQIIHPVLDYSYPTDITGNNPYGYQRLDIQPGMQHMDGEHALQYVRSRHEDVVGDFGRTQRQRQLLLTLKNTVLTTTASLGQIPSLFDSLNGQTKTDLTPVIALQLGSFFLTNKIIPNQFTLTLPTYSQIGWSADNQSIVIGNATNSAQLISNVFGSSAGTATYNSLVSVQDLASQSATPTP
ncbi:MAG TPA: LCP family protein [Candidatus Saccharimonadales bacterium]|nr:LCP family protein [Candidatus Saccharimonadales bacterium]